MSNVLPREFQKVNWNVRVAHFVTIFSFALTLLAAALLLVLAPSYIALNAAAGDPAIPSDAKGDALSELLAAQTLVTAMMPVVGITSTSSLEALQAAFTVRPAGLTIRQISYTRGDPSTLVLTGSAPGRLEVNAYRQALSSNPHFTSVNVPIGNLIGTDSGDFTVTLTGQF